MSNIQKAIAYFQRRGIIAYENDGSLYVSVDGYEIQTTSAEVDYRAELYDLDEV